MKKHWKIKILLMTLVIMQFMFVTIAEQSSALPLKAPKRATGSALSGGGTGPELTIHIPTELSLEGLVDDFKISGYYASPVDYLFYNACILSSTLLPEGLPKDIFLISNTPMPTYTQTYYTTWSDNHGNTWTEYATIQYIDGFTLPTRTEFDSWFDKQLVFEGYLDGVFAGYLDENWIFSRIVSINLLRNGEAADIAMLLDISDVGGSGVPFVPSVPEPATIVLLLTGLIGLAGFRKRFIVK